MRMFGFTGLGALAFALACSSASAATAALPFDKPLHEKRLALPPDPYNPQGKPALTCFYFPHLMVKQVDLGEKGAEQLSMTFVPKGQPEPACQRADAKDEKVVDSNAWSGYFKGVKGDYVFFEGSDGAEGGESFAVFGSADAGKLFDDLASEMHSVELMAPVQDIDQRPWYENPLTLRYQRLYLAPCSLRSDAKRCWGLVQRATGLTEKSPPDCSASYQAIEKQAPPEQLQATMADPSLIRYEVEVVLDGHGVIRVTPVSKALECFAAE
jgi:hypothetical protein